MPVWMHVCKYVWLYVMQCNAMHCNAMQCHAMPCNVMYVGIMVWYGTVWYGTVCNAMLCNAMLCCTCMYQCTAKQCTVVYFNARLCFVMYVYTIYRYNNTSYHYIICNFGFHTFYVYIYIYILHMECPFLGTSLAKFDDTVQCAPPPHLPPLCALQRRARLALDLSGVQGEPSNARNR